LRIHWPASAATKPIAISIVDDDRVVLRAMQQMLRRSGLFHGISVFGSGTEALAALRPEAVQVVLMDIVMPGMSGIECTQRLKSQLPEVKILMVTALVDTDVMTQAMRAGADGYLIKPFTALEGLQAIQLALCGGMPMSKAVIQELESWVGRLDYAHRAISGYGLRPLLDDRETAVMQLLVQGKLYKEITGQLHQSVSMVNKLIHQIYKKLKVNNRTEAINCWLHLNNHPPCGPGMS